MPKLGLGLSLVARGRPVITQSRAFDSAGNQVGSTVTGPIPPSWLLNQSTVSSVVFANDGSVSTFGLGAFENCINLASITLPESLQIMLNKTFKGCTSLASIVIPDSVLSVGDESFRNCTSLQSVTIGSGLGALATQLFFGCSSLASITIPNTVTSIGVSTFQTCTSLANVTIGANVAAIGSGAFISCTSLTSITIPASVTAIGDPAFFLCTNLATVNCYVPKTTPSLSGAGSLVFSSTASPLTIHARINDSTWGTSGVTGQTIAGNTNVTVIRDLV